jgi:hypothetical protein
MAPAFALRVSKADEVAMASDLLTLLRGQAQFSFSRIVTADESWFLYLSQSDHIFVPSRDEMIRREKSTIDSRKVKVTTFFIGAKLFCLQALPPGARYIEEYFINRILPDIVHESGQILRRVHPGDFFVYMDNSMCHNDYKVTPEFEVARLDRFPHPTYSPKLNPCDV